MRTETTTARERWFAAAIGISAPLILLFLFGRDGLWSDFFPDEMMNMYWYWRETWSTLLRWNVLFFEGHYRPLGALFYGPLFELYGFNPLPFRAVCFGLLAANILITYAVLRSVTACGPLASLGALFSAYHAYFADLYYSSATIYDLMCYFFYYGSLLYYIRQRRRNRLRGRDLLVLGILYVAALNSKEMAVTLPFLLLAYEFLFVPPSSRLFRGAMLCGAVAVCAILPKLIGQDSMVNTGGYALSLDRVVSNLGHYLGMLFYVHASLAKGAVFALGIGLFALALAFRRKPHVAFAVSIIVLTPIPVLAIAPRSLYVFYIPMLGWSLLAACLVWYLWPVRLVPHRVREMVAVGGCLALLIPLHSYRKPFGDIWVPAEQRKVRAILTALDDKLPVIGRSARVLFLDDPFEADDWILTFIFRLRYRDDTIQVHRQKQSGPVPRELWKDYDYVVTAPDWRLKVFKDAV